jgi:hypothetical protein
MVMDKARQGQQLMARTRYFRALVALGALASIAATSGGPPPQARVAPARDIATHDVIVVLRDQLTGIPPQRRAMQTRSAALASAQNAVFERLPANARRKKALFQTINAFATTVSPAEADLLAQDPNVLAVIPDRIVRMTRLPASVPMPDAAVAGPTKAGVVTAVTDPSQLCDTLEPQALQLTHAAFLDPAIPQAQQVRDGNGQLVTGRGVTIAYLADGLDPNLPGFTRPDGTPVFIDYQDFSGDPPGTPTDGREAFLDASSIAAQDNPGGMPLTFDISTFTNAAGALPSPCNIRIRGMAPGVSLVGLSTNTQIGTVSTYVRAIEYAVVVDDVDVINESFAAYTLPDETIDPISLANKSAIQAGVTVVVATGDAGPGGTIGVPASDADVIAAGATTQMRSLAQTGYSAISLATAGYVDNDIAAFSSGGFTQRTGRTVDVVAPGFLGWALCSTNTSLFSGCHTLSVPSTASPIQLSGGTSEAAPLIAGEAALVIQAYRSTHGGRSPAPSLIKRIIMSTSTDLGAPPEEQGSGLINALSAVYAALAANGAQDVAAQPAGGSSGVLVTAAPGSFSVTDMPGARKKLAITLTNLGSQPRLLSPTMQSLTTNVVNVTQVIAIDTAGGQTFLNYFGAQRAYVQQPIDVPANVDHLDVSVSYPTTIGSASNPYVVLALIDASGRLVSDSEPQGLTNGFQHVEALRPAAGTWTAVIYTRGNGFAGSYSGPIQFNWTAERMAGFGSVSPSHLTLAPGASATLTAAFSMPQSPGDSAAEIRFSPLGSEAASSASIPLSLRTLVPVSSQGAVFSGTLTGGNSRARAGQTQFFSFDVPPGVRDMNLILDVPDSGYLLQGILVDPHGLPYGFNSNEDPGTGAPTTSMQLNRYEPVPGRWQFSLTNYFVTSGQQTAMPFNASLAFNAARVTAQGLPNSDKVALSASAAPLSVPIVVTNNSRTTQMYFADARRSTSVPMDLPIYTNCTNPPTLPFACFGSTVPPQSRVVSFGAQSTVPFDLEASAAAGTLTSGTVTYSATILGRQDGTSGTTATLSASEIPYSTWWAFAALTGPFGPQGPGVYPVDFSATALARDFDTAMITDSGDAWTDLLNLTASFDPLVLAPGQSGVIRLYIQPDPGRIGKVVSGDIFIDTFNFVQFNGDELVRIPYRYRVVK